MELGKSCIHMKIHLEYVVLMMSVSMFVWMMFRCNHMFV